MHKHKQYPIRFPRNAAGIRAQEARANGGRSWWAVEWMRHLESMGMKARLGRGKNYALSGQVTALQIEFARQTMTANSQGVEDVHRKNSGNSLGREPVYQKNSDTLRYKEGGLSKSCRVVATVLGARPDPYTVTLAFRPLDAEAKARVIAALKKDPMLVARLLAGDLPLEVARLFRQEGFDLFPGGKLGPREYDVTMSCSCPDYANPCKHTAAVLLLLGEEIDREPLRLLEFRGISIKELCDED